MLKNTYMYNNSRGKAPIKIYCETQNTQMDHRHLLWKRTDIPGSCMYIYETQKPIILLLPR